MLDNFLILGVGGQCEWAECNSMARGKVMADCKALSQYGDKGSPPDGRPFTLGLLHSPSTWRLQLSLHAGAEYNTYTMKKGFLAVSREGVQIQCKVAREASVDQIWSQGAPYGRLFLFFFLYCCGCSCEL